MEEHILCSSKGCELLLPWLVPSSRVAGIADDLILRAVNIVYKWVNLLMGDNWEI